MADNKMICPHCHQPYSALQPVPHKAPPTVQTPANGNGRLVVPSPARRINLLDPATLIAPQPPPQLLQATTASQVPQQVHPFEQKPKTQAVQKQQKPVSTTADPFDDPAVGGKFTIFILMYGNYFDMHKRCLNNILSTVPAERREVRVGCNEVCPDTLSYLSRLKDEGHVDHVINSATNDKKYPMMRRMFHEGEPINTKWLLWFDDDSMADKDPAWVHKLADLMVNIQNSDNAMIGQTKLWKIQGSQGNWIKSRPWYAGRGFQMRGGQEAPNGQWIRFAEGGFWAMRVDAMRKAGIPDDSLGHNGGDYMLGEQLWQAGYSTKHWNQGKCFVTTSSVDRRGLSEKHTGTTGWKAGGK
jgi:hypothetical protein